MTSQTTLRSHDQLRVLDLFSNFCFVGSGDHTQQMHRYIVLSVLLAASLYAVSVHSSEWPVPYMRHSSRPPVNPYCKHPLYAFCPTGYTDGHIPVMAANDTIEVFLMKAPVFEFRFGDLLGKFNIIHDAIGFRSKLTGLNYTSEWYELGELFNCTFPHVLANRTSPLWCNQGAACFYPGIDDKHWKQNGSLVKVAEMTGDTFNELADYIHWDNHTGIYYETWRVRNSTGPDNIEWFTPYDCANYVIRMFQYMGTKLSVKFTETYKANYTFVTLYSDMPQFLGNESAIFANGGNSTLALKLMDFYRNFQAHQTVWHYLEHLLAVIDYVIVEKVFYLYYNSAYWLLPMKTPYMRITYEYVPFVMEGQP